MGDLTSELFHFMPEHDGPGDTREIYIVFQPAEGKLQIYRKADPMHKVLAGLITLKDANAFAEQMAERAEARMDGELMFWPELFAREVEP